MTSESREVAAPKKTLESWLTGEEFKRQLLWLCLSTSALIDFCAWP